MIPRFHPGNFHGAQVWPSPGLESQRPRVDVVGHGLGGEPPFSAVWRDGLRDGVNGWFIGGYE